MNDTLVGGDKTFLEGLDPQFVADDLVDYKHVKVAMEKHKGWENAPGVDPVEVRRGPHRVEDGRRCRHRVGNSRVLGVVQDDLVAVAGHEVDLAVAVAAVTPQDAAPLLLKIAGRQAFTPAAHTSARRSRGRPRACSGATSNSSATCRAISSPARPW